MATILKLVQNRLPDEAVLFSESLADYIEEGMAAAGYDGIAEDSLSVLQKGLVADYTAKALILPAMSYYKKEIAKAEADGGGTAEFVDKLKFLNEMAGKLSASITEKESKLSSLADAGVPLIVVEDE